MEKTIIIGLDLAKNVFQAHGARADGSVAFRKKLTRSQVLPFFAGQPVCLVAMEACASAHHWARSIRDLGSGLIDHIQKMTMAAIAMADMKVWAHRS